MRSLTTALDLLDLAVASAEGLASEEARYDAAKAAAAARDRQDHFSDAVIVAIAGGTGSGKSSLLNAIAGRPVASTSTLRPHTDTPLAWIPADDPAIARMIEHLDIADVVVHDDELHLAIIDLPDLDSVDGEHRTLVEAALPLVDAVIWVFDPIKYHDPSIHADFLTHLVHYEPVFTFVLNKTDRLDEAEAEAVSTHLGVILGMDGFRDPGVVAVAADPPSEEPVGIGELVDVLKDALVAKRADRAKLIEDVLRAGRALAAESDAWSGTADDSRGCIENALDDPQRLHVVLDELGIAGPLRASIVAAEGDRAVVERLLLQRAELAATVAALGVACAELSNSRPELLV